MRADPVPESVSMTTPCLRPYPVLLAIVTLCVFVPGCSSSRPVAAAAVDAQADTPQAQDAAAADSADVTQLPDGTTADSGPADAEVGDLGSTDAADVAVGDDAGDADGQDAADASSADAPTFAEVQKVALSGCGGFGPMGCHSKEPFAGGLDLRPDHAWASLVGVDSTSHPGILRVQPGQPGQSMLIRKLIDQLADDGSEGEPMPKGEAMKWTEPPYVGLVSDWIAAGAPND